MARIADGVIERIKTEVSLVRLAETQGYPLQKQGKDFALCCPFHEDKTPSCVITPKSNLFNCFGCGAGGSVIDWVMKTQGVSFRHAVELLKNKVVAPAHPAPATYKASLPIKTTVPKLAAPVSVDADDQTLLREVVDYYHETLQQSPEALAYLESRGLNDPELINHFKLGYANRTLGLRLPQKNRKTGAELREKLQRLGVYRESGHEHLNGSLVVPLFNAAGDVVQLYGRKIRNDLREGTPLHLYLAGDHAGVFNYAGLVGCEEITLCEALIDALTFWRWGFKNVTSSYGVNGFTDEILNTLVELNIKRVLIAYDRDEAGNIAAEKVAKQLNENGIDAFRVLFPKGMDANEYALKVTPAPKSLGVAIRKAEWIGNGNKNESVPIVDESVLAAKEEIAQEITSSLAAKVTAPKILVDANESEINLTVETPTVADRVAQMVVKMTLEPEWDHKFHSSSYGYRPKRSAHHAVQAAKINCWKYSWVIDLDIKGFFDNLNHDQLQKSVAEATDIPWCKLYIKRWITAGVQMPNGEIQQAEKGTPQGGVISPLLANLYLHKVFDSWMQKYFPQNPFERYADDIVCHCRTEREANRLLGAIAQRLQRYDLTLHPEKTKIVYCGRRKIERTSAQSFDFLGFTFRRRTVKRKDGKLVPGFVPAISNKAKKAKKAIVTTMKEWKVRRLSRLSIVTLSRKLNPQIRGWLNYYGAFYPSALQGIREAIQCRLYKWVKGKYPQKRSRRLNAHSWLTQIEQWRPTLFAHW